MKTNVSSALPRDEREVLREAFLEREGFAGVPLSPLPADCSKRRYFRLPSMLLMDAPPSHESTVSFQVMADFLRDAGLTVPCIYASDHENGFLLVEDLGELTFRKAIERGLSETMLYGEVIQSLIHLHQKVTDNTITLSSFNLNLFLSGTEVYLDWYGLPLSPQAKEDFQGLWRDAYHQQPKMPHSIVMRDVMVDNLMWLPSRTGFQRCGFIDFQDGVWGPISYDLVSHLQDGRRDISPQFAKDMVELYLKAFPELNAQDFWTSYALWGAQLSTRLLGLFHRLAKRDGKPQYTVHLPRVKATLEHNLSHPSLRPIRGWFQSVGL
ncbi:MAG: phosphotransferase [Alphaproteobacteria bacterium]|nr:phosphotransferase [Alphaproteobacteria bacterium]